MSEKITLSLGLVSLSLAGVACLVYLLSPAMASVMLLMSALGVVAMVVSTLIEVWAE